MVFFLGGHNSSNAIKTLGMHLAFDEHTLPLCLPWKIVTM
jgi:hypothetical protein